MIRSIISFWQNRNGSQTIEYAMIAALIVVGLIVALTSIGTSTTAMYENLDKGWDDAMGG